MEDKGKSVIEPGNRQSPGGRTTSQEAAAMEDADGS